MGKRYIDYVGTWGPAILGHAPAVVIEAVRETAGPRSKLRDSQPPGS
jgi:glutamate-1-semialdehyde aminotransferase